MDIVCPMDKLLQEKLIGKQIYAYLKIQIFGIENYFFDHLECV